MFKRKNKNKVTESGKVIRKQKLLRKQYKTAGIIFGTGLICILASPIITGNEYRIESIEVGTKYPLTDSIQVEIAKVEYNPGNQLFRIDYDIATKVNDPTLVNLEFTAKAKTMADLKTEVPGQIVQVNPKYYTVYFENIPEDFEAIGVTLKPNYIEESITTDEGMAQRAIHAEFKQEDVTVSNVLVKKSGEQLEYDALKSKQEELAKEVAELKEKLRVDEIKYSNFIITLDEAKKTDTQFMTDEELLEHENGIKNVEQQMAQLEKSIEKLKADLKTKEEGFNELKTKIEMKHRGI